ncbi:MAG: farnesyl-diphosphate synthase [Rickettsiales bacterium]|nr:farnesyl-diphosphate synthase [Rickettsiales bacterium]|tara:strand:- start:643 stop:1539 length:897 start_codon:yes stop_codon:yes gene_type:complete
MKNKIENVEDYLNTFSTEFDKKLFDLIPKSEKFSSKLFDAMHYVIKVGGKRLRPVFLMEIGQILGVEKAHSLRTAASIEFIHCYSLVHDDLPAMDNDDIRRGSPTCHKKYDDATAILVGDAFQSLAFEILADNKTHPNPEIRCSLINELAKSSGSVGMVGGQMLDLEAEKKKLDLDQILQLQRLKTGELFRFSCLASCILSQRLREISIFEDFASKLGLAFQIKDDLLDVEGDEKQIGKKTKKDLGRGKETLISLMGKENAKKKSKDLIVDAIKLLETFGEKAEKLIELTNFIISRNK